MHDLRDLAERIERLLLRHEELKRTNTLLTDEIGMLTAERDALRSRLVAARARMDSLIERLPRDSAEPSPESP
jgi:cell division protein ZapB